MKNTMINKILDGKVEIDGNYEFPKNTIKKYSKEAEAFIKGKYCLKGKGTYFYREEIKADGFTWNREYKCWWIEMEGNKDLYLKWCSGGNIYLANSCIAPEEEYLEHLAMEQLEANELYDKNEAKKEKFFNSIIEKGYDREMAQKIYYKIEDSFEPKGHFWTPEVAYKNRESTIKWIKKNFSKEAQKKIGNIVFSMSMSFYEFV